MDDDYRIWNETLAGRRVVAHVDKPGCGFWILRWRGQRIPIAIWRSTKHNGELRCRTGFAGAQEDDQAKNWWMYCIDNAITEDAYRAAVKAGHWPDDPGAMEGPVAQLDERQTSNLEDAGSIPAGVAIPARTDNLPDDIEPLEGADPFHTMKARFVQLDRLAKQAGHDVTDQASADMASNISARLKLLAKQAEDQRKIEKKPFDDGAAAVQAKWTPLKSAIALTEGAVSRTVTIWLNAEEARLRTAAAAAVQAGATPADAAPRPVRAGGAVTGRRTALRTYKTAKITDYPALLAHLKDHPDVVAAVRSVADASARSGIPLPGMEIAEDRRAV